MHADLSLEQHLRLLEEQLLSPEIRKSTEDINVLLAKDFVEFGSSGFVFDRKRIVEKMQTEPPIRRSIVDFKVVLLAENVALATYRAIRHAESGENPTYSLRSSIWKHIDGRWQIVFHQGTLSMEA
jgi:hypothetical protein